MDITETESKGLESAVKQPVGIAAAITDIKPQSPTREDLERSLVSAGYKLEEKYYVKLVEGYKLEVELMQNPTNENPSWYLNFYRVSNGEDIQLCSASGHSYEIAELQKLQADALKFKCCVKKTKVADF